MADKRKNIVLRFGIIYTIICLSFLLVLYRIFVIQFIEKDKWLALASQSIKTNIVVKPIRGNIYAADGRLMASSIPTYYIYMDLRVPALHLKNGKLFKENIDSVSICLAKFLKDKSASEYKRDLTRAYRSNIGEYQIFPKRITYAQLKQLKTFPLFRLGRNKSGLITKELVRRVKPFGSLATRTIGDIYADETKGGKNGLELYFNQQLLGTPGISIRQKIANSYMETVEVEPIDGMDINTTLDVDFQDIAEKALVDSLKSFDAGSGYVVLMEVQTGEVKAIVNMQQNEDGSYSENKNGVVSDMVEPGSTFKVASLMVALDDGIVKITDSIDTGNGVYRYANSDMRDHNYHHGGYHKISVANVIHASSNVGISKIIDKAYGHNPSKFVDMLYNMKLNEPLDLEIPGTAKPQIRHPKDKSKYWSATTLPWMSIGYETQIPPIYTLAFYNAIANNGKYIRPFFVKSISKNGQIIKAFTTETIKESICKPTTLRDIHEVLLGVIEGKYGTASNMKSDYVRIAGKTGTAQISKGALGYKSGGKTHQVSFCGYFPADNPQYSCIVVIREPRKGYPSGGKMAGSIFKNVAERVMALKSNNTPQMFASKDTTTIKPAAIKNGNFKAIATVMTEMKLQFITSKTDWVKINTINDKRLIEPINLTQNTVPELMGMGAKDAVFLLEKIGFNIQVSGRGKIVSQNPEAGTKIKKGSTVAITLE